MLIKLQFSKNLQQNNSETVTSHDGHDEEIPKKTYVSSEERQEIIDELIKIV